MGINIADNFQYQSQKPLDGRTKYDTTAAMKAVPDSSMYDGCLAYCSETDKTYQWKSSNSVDTTLGRWRVFEAPNAYHTTDSAETSISDTDYFPFLDGNTPKKSLWSNIKSVLKTYFDTLYDLNKSDIPFYATSSTGASTTAKVATVTRGTYSLVAGAKVTVKFTYSNTASAPTLNVGSTGAKNIKYIDSNGTVTTPTTWWGAGDVVTFIYDGTQWIMQPTVALVQPNVAYGFTPVGTIISVMGNSAPTNYLKCDGTVYNISSYPELANYFYAQFGSKNKFGGNGTTTFAVPDLRGEFLRGTGTNSHSEQGSGANVGTHQDATRHVNAFGFGNNQIFVSAEQNTTSGFNSRISNTDSFKNRVANMSVSASYTSSTSSYEQEAPTYTSRPTNTSVLYCIAVKDIYMNPADTYSTSEQVVGKWIDGSYLYQRTWSCGSLPRYKDTPTNIPVNITNFKRLISARGYAFNGTAANIALPGYNELDKTTNGIRCNGASIFISSSVDLSTDSVFTESYVTLQYTKTT